MPLRLPLDAAPELFARMAARTPGVIERTGMKCARDIQRTAVLKIGRLQPPSGPFPAWPPLAPRTLEDKARLGYKGDGAPLLRTSEMRDSIEARALGGHRFVTGSADVKMVWQDQGTSDGHVPPRPVLGPAAYESLPAIKARLTAALRLLLEARR